jgi:phosphomannomutase/phosphoglucomutase
MKKEIFREYDIRGRADIDYDVNFAETLGKAIGTEIRKRDGKSVLVAHDARLTSPKFYEATILGLVSTGLEVLTGGLCATPSLYFGVHHYETDGGVMITGSHNPPDYNGFKICYGTGAIHGSMIQDLYVRMDSGDFVSGDGHQVAKALKDDYLRWLVDHFGKHEKPLKVVVDGGNGCGGIMAPDLYRAMGCEVVELYCEPDGNFPNHHPDPTVIENLADIIASVRENRADLGIAFDGDADRIGVVDEKGNVVFADEQMILFAREILSNNPGATVIGEVKCSKRLYDDIEAKGGKPIMWKTGHSLIKAKMKETGALLAGEMSGHICFADSYYGFDDAVYAGGRLLRIMQSGERELSDYLKDLPEVYNTPEIRIDADDQRKFEIVDQALSYFRDQYEVNDIDGARINFGDGWGLIRASNTQPVLVMRFEAISNERLVEIEKIVSDKVKELMTT